MRVEIEFDDAVAEWVKEQQHRSFARCSADEVSEIIIKLLDALYGYDDMAEALRLSIRAFKEEHADYLKDVVIEEAAR